MEVTLRSLAKSYGSTVAVDDVSIELPRGEMLALLGPSGCGKTTTLRMVAGFVQPTGGRILIRDRDLTRVPPHKRDIGLVFQNYALFPHMMVEENIAFGLRRRGVPTGETASRVRAIVAKMRLDGLERRLPRELSGGQQQRVAVARALVINPTVLLLDEPFSNLDAKLRESTGIELRRLQKELGLTSIFVTHDQQEAMAIADRVAVMNEGRIDQIGTAADIYQRPETRFVAEFIGRANFLRATVKAADEAAVVVALASGSELRVADQRKWRPGQLVTVMIRPEAIQVTSPEAAPDQTSVPGVVELASYHGAFVHAVVALTSGETLIAEIRGLERSNVRMGEQAALTFDSSGVVLFERAQAEGEIGSVSIV